VSPRPAPRSQTHRETGTPAANRQRRYFVPLVLLEDDPVELGDDELEPLVLGVDDLLVSVEVELELDPDVDGAVLEGGEADGGVLPGRSVTRSVRDSLQAVSIPALSATAMAAVSILFISRTLLLVGLRDPGAEKCNGYAAGRRLTPCGRTITNAE
jgi:hypothetical protein